MRVVLAVSLLVAASFAAPASASKPDALLDFTCGFTSITDPRPESSYSAQLGYIEGGPVAQSGTLTCTIKVDAATHAAPYEHGATATATGTGVTVLAPTVVSYILPEYSVIYLCDEFTDAEGVTWYWDDGSFDWTTDANGLCQSAISGATDAPIFNPLDDVVDDLVNPVVCPVLAALSPGAPPLVDIRADGDTFVGGARLVDCPPYSEGDGVVDERVLSLVNSAPPPRTSGAIRVSDTGDGPSWEVSGTLVSVDWQCGADGTAVVCDWDGYRTAPRCREAAAVAAVLAAEARSRTRASCVRGTVVESATTGVASAAMPVSYAERGTTALPVTSLRCEADDGAGGPPVAPYVTTCGFTF